MLNIPVMQKLVNGQKGNAGTNYAGAWMVKPVNTMSSWLSVTRKWYIWTLYETRKTVWFPRTPRNGPGPI